MGNQTDHKAEYGYQPTWDRQRAKQEAHAEAFYGESDEQAAEAAAAFLSDEKDDK